MIHLVTYDLHQPGRDYAKIEAKIDELADDWAHPQGSVWLVDTLLKPRAWVDGLKAAGDPNDEVFVIQLRQNWSATRMDAEVVTWLKQPARRWL